ALGPPRGDAVPDRRDGRGAPRRGLVRGAAEGGAADPRRRLPRRDLADRREEVIRSIIGFSTIAVAILAALHFYAWKRLVRDVDLPRPWRRLATVVVVLLALV